ncbi:helix-turn-helix transcriptional regulator [Candidatus Fermentibacteria bacterium]|nr:helix-turn-helix transcriptional regulator [Candidatus Fermentibacteria bacterium]
MEWMMTRLPSDEEVAELARLYSLAADPTRLKLLLSLLEGEKCVCELSASAGTSVSAASHQLRLLRSGSLVSPRREGRHIFYKLADDHVRAFLELSLEHARE